MVQGCSPSYKVAPWDILAYREPGRGGKGIAYVTVGNVKLAQKIVEGLDDRKFDGRHLRTEYTLGRPCQDVYVSGMGGLLQWEVKDVMEAYGRIERVEGIKGQTKGASQCVVVVVFAPWPILISHPFFPRHPATQHTHEQKRTKTLPLSPLPTPTTRWTPFEPSIAAGARSGT